MQLYTPAPAVDFTDTGQWRMTIYISRRGISTFLRHCEDASQPVVRPFSTEWADDGQPLLPRIEAAVYDNPRLFDDYATEIVLETRMLTWAPTDWLDGEESEREVFETIFPGAEREVLTERVGDMTALFMLVYGLQPFVVRTLPGARIRSHMGVLANRLRRLHSPMPRIYADIREGEADILAFSDEKMLCAATHEWREADDIAYHILHLAEDLGFDRAEMLVSLSGAPESREETAASLRPHCPHIETTPIAAEVAGEMPLAAAIAAGF